MTEIFEEIVPYSDDSNDLLVDFVFITDNNNLQSLYNNIQRLHYEIFMFLNVILILLFVISCRKHSYKQVSLQEIQVADKM